MNSTTLRRALSTLGLTQNALSRQLRINIRDIRRMANDATPVSERVQAYLEQQLRERIS